MKVILLPCSSLSPLRTVNQQQILINIGILQSSILGLLLFLIYANDLHNATSYNPRLFADDTCLVLSNPSKLN